MDWIKKNPAQTALLAIAIGVLASTYFLWSEVSQFSSSFNIPTAPANPPKGIPKTDLAVVTNALTSIKSPGQWTFNETTQGSLFVSDNYVKDSGALKKPEGGYFQMPIPNLWLKKYGLSFLNKDVVNEDPDKDGFSVRIEWDGMDGLSHLSDKHPGEPVAGPDGKPLPDDSTNPIDPKSHPPYFTRLRLAPLPNQAAGVVSIPFRLKLMVIDVNPKNPKDVTFQINTVDKGNASRYIPLGEMIPGTLFKAERWEKKETKDANGIVHDESVLTVINTKTGQNIPLPIGQVVNSPESYVVLRYLWVEPGKQPTPDMNKRKDETFKLPPETDITYKVVDIKAPGPQNNPPGEVTIEMTSDKDPTQKRTLILKTNDYLSTVLN